MKRAANQSLGFSRQRGIWLRCFLGIRPLSVFAFALIVVSANAQIVILKPLHVSHARGYVVNESGKPIATIRVELAREGRISLYATTDNAGEFSFAHVTGRYLLRVKADDAAIAARDVIVGAGPRALFHRGPIYVMLTLGGACEDCNSPVFANKAELDRTIRQNAELGH